MINVNMTDKAGVTLATAGKYCADNVKVTPSAAILRKDEQAKTATPTTSAQDITPDAGKALSKVTVNPITAAIVGDLDADSFAPAIVAAVEGKGVTVPDGTLLDGMAALIESIKAGGGSGIVYTSGTLFFSSDTSGEGYVITHGLGTIPQIFIITAKYLKSGDYVLQFYLEISEGVRNLGYGAEKFCVSYANNGVGYSKRIDVTGNKSVAIDENTITVDNVSMGIFSSGVAYYWCAIGGIAV